MDNHPLSTVFEAARTTAGGVFTFGLGVIGGTALAIFIALHDFGPWYWYPFATLFLVPYAIHKLWGLLLMPLYGLIFYGLVWNGWNRFICFSVLAIATSLVMLLSFEKNPFSDWGTAVRFLIVEGVLGGVLVAGVLVERGR